MPSQASSDCAAWCVLIHPSYFKPHFGVCMCEQSEGGEVVLDDDMKALSHYGLAGSASVLLSVL